MGHTASQTGALKACSGHSITPTPSVVHTQTCHIKFRNSDLAAEVTRSLFNTARQYRESFDVYGSKKTFEWTLVEHEDSVIHTGEKPERVKIPDYAHLLPESIQSFTTGGVYDADSNNIYLLYKEQAMAAHILIW